MSFDFQCKLLWQTDIFRQEHFAKDTRSKFDLFSVVVLLDASLDVLQGKFHMFSGTCFHHFEKLVSVSFNVGVIAWREFSFDDGGRLSVAAQHRFLRIY
jgi:hypothetical protein